MIGVALKGLAGRKIRALLTAFAVVIGVSMVSGTFILTDTMQKSFNGLFDASFDKTDAVIRGKEIVKDSFSGSGVTIPESVLTKVRALPEVEAASGDVSPRRPTRPTSSARTARPSPRRAQASATTPPTRASPRSSSRPANGPRAPSRSSSTPAPPPRSTTGSATP